MSTGPVLLIGFPKCASTTAYELLRQHPRIAATVRKETWILYPAAWGQRPATEGELDTFAASFAVAGPDELALEASSGNVYLPPAVIEQLRERFPQARPIVVVREPVARLVSAYTFMRARGLFGRTSFARFVEQGLEGVRRSLPFEPGTADRFHVVSGLYGRHLRPWVEIFDGELAVVDADALRERSEQVTADLWSYLGLPGPPAEETGNWELTTGTWNRTGRLAPSLDGVPTRLRADLTDVLLEDAAELADLLERIRGPIHRGTWLRSLPAAP